MNIKIIAFIKQVNKFNSGKEEGEKKEEQKNRSCGNEEEERKLTGYLLRYRKKVKYY